MRIDFSTPDTLDLMGCAASFLVVLVILIYFEIKSWWEDRK